MNEKHLFTFYRLTAAELACFEPQQVQAAAVKPAPKIVKTENVGSAPIYEKKNISVEMNSDQINKRTVDNGIIKSSSEEPAVKTKSHKRIIAAVVGLIVVTIPLIIFLSTRNENGKAILSSSSNNESAVNTTVPIHMDNGMLIVDQKLFGMSHDDAEAYLGKSLGAPVDFSWWSAHLTLYNYAADGYNFNVFFNDSDELAIIQLDEKKDFDKSIVDKFTAKFGKPSSSGGNYYSFNVGSDLSLNVDEDIYLESNEGYFRQQYVSSKYYY